MDLIQLSKQYEEDRNDLRRIFEDISPNVVLTALDQHALSQLLMHVFDENLVAMDNQVGLDHIVYGAICGIVAKLKS